MGKPISLSAFRTCREVGSFAASCSRAVFPRRTSPSSHGSRRRRMPATCSRASSTSSPPRRSEWPTATMRWCSIRSAIWPRRSLIWTATRKSTAGWTTTGQDVRRSRRCVHATRRKSSTALGFMPEAKTSMSICKRNCRRKRRITKH